MPKRMRHPNPMKRSIAAHQAIAAREAANEVDREISKLIDFGEAKYGYGNGNKYGPFISGGFREHWPNAIKDKIRTAHRKKNQLNREAELLWKKAGKRKRLPN